MKAIEIGRLYFAVDRPLDSSQSHLFRGFITGLFPDNELIHNHNLQSGECRYRYPLIQYKIIDGMPMIVAIGTEAIDFFRDHLPQLEQMRIGRRWFNIEGITMEIDAEPLGIGAQMLNYRFLTPWIALNSRNYSRYYSANADAKQELLRNCLIGNMLSLSKYLDYIVYTRIELGHKLQHTTVVLKGKRMLGFVGLFKTNFHLPDFIGLGKSCSRGYGCCIDFNRAMLLASSIL